MPRKKRKPIILTLDTETVGLDGDLKRIAIYDGVAVTYGYRFPDVEWKIVDYYNKGFMPYVYIHNLDFDARKIPELFEKGNIVWNSTRKIGSKYATIRCVKYTIKDSYKILAASLAKLSKDFEVEHGKIDLWERVQQDYPNQYTDIGDFFARCDPDNPLYVEYLGYDVISLYEVLYKVMELAKLEVEDFIHIMSTASLSRYLLKNGYGGEPFRDPANSKTDFEILTQCKAWSSKKYMQGCEVTYQECEYKMRDGFYGGRTEVFTPYLAPDNGKIVGWHYDVNSLYPAQMIKYDFPVGYPSYENHPELIEDNWLEWLDRKRGLGFIKCDVFIPEQKIPPLPCKMGKLAFVTGYVTGTWTYIELEYAVKNCGVKILKFHEQIHFKKTYPVFKRFVSTFYKMKEDGKKQGKDSITAFAKLCLNTAYGWTTLRRDDKTGLRDISLLEKWKDNERFLYQNDELGYFEILENVTAESIQVQVGAYVTSYARLVLLEALRAAAERGTVYYCDTDSIVCDTMLPPELVDPYEIGKWDLEGELTSGIFLQPKVYLESVGGKDKIKFKGVTRNAQKELSRKDYEYILELLRQGIATKHIIERGRETLPTLAVAQKKHENPNQLKVSDKGINTGSVQKRNIDYKSNVSKAWHMESKETFENFNFGQFRNPPDGKNIFGG